MIDFRIVRKVPTELVLRAYTYKLIESGFGLSNIIVENMMDVFPSLSDEPCKWDLNKLPIDKIQSVLKNQDILPNEIYFFKQDYDKIDFSSNDYKLFPDIFTGVKNVSFDNGGLIVMEYFKSQIYSLFNDKGIGISDYCHDLELGTNGLVSLRHSDDNSGFWEILQYDGNKLESFDTYLSPDEFPFIRNRDIIPEMFPLGSFPIPENYSPKNISKEDVINELAKNEYYFRYLTNYYYDNEELALVAVDSNILAFTLLSERLQNKKEFVVKLIARNEKNQLLYPYLENSFKKDIEIIKLCVSGNPRIIESFKPVNDKELLLIAVRKDCSVLKYADTKLLQDKDFMLNVVRLNGIAIEFASDKLRNDKSLALEAVKNNGFALKFVSDELKDDKDVVLEAVKNKKHAIDYASENLKNHEEFDDIDELPF
jgi:hypothetical protein